MVISKDWSVRTKNGTVCKDIYLRLWPWPCLHIEDHFYVKQDDQFKKNGFKEILNWDLQDLIQGKYHEWIEIDEVTGLLNYSSSLGTFIYKFAELKGKRARGPLERYVKGMVLIEYYPTIDPIHKYVTDLIITWTILKKNESGTCYIPSTSGFLAGTDFPTVINNTLETATRVRDYRITHFLNPTQF